MKYQSFLIKYAEIGIKGKNRHIFEEALVRQIKHALKPCEGNFAVHRTYGRVFVECLSDYDYSEVTEALSRVFGISGNCPIKEMSVVPIGELSTNFVTEHEAEFTKYVKLACAPRETYIKAFNKQITFDQAMESGIPCPYTRRSDQSIEDYLEKCHFPIIIKPRQGLGSIGFHKFEKREDFWPFMRERNLDPDDYVVQEFVNYEDRISANLFVDQKKNICTSYAVDALRWFPIDAGAGVLSETVDAHEVLNYAGRLLQDLGWKGFAQVAFMMDRDSGEPRLQEINGRIPASIKMAYMCGFNISRQMLEMAYDEDVIRYPENDKFGMYIRHLVHFQGAISIQRRLRLTVFKPIHADQIRFRRHRENGIRKQIRKENHDQKDEHSPHISSSSTDSSASKRGIAIQTETSIPLNSSIDAIPDCPASLQKKTPRRVIMETSRHLSSVPT